MAVPVQFRILALSATPGCKSPLYLSINQFEKQYFVRLLIEFICHMSLYSANHQTIQQVIDNLQISSLEHRNESDPDVAPYVHDRKIELIRVHFILLNLQLEVSISTYSLMYGSVWIFFISNDSYKKAVIKDMGHVGRTRFFLNNSPPFKKKDYLFWTKSFSGQPNLAYTINYPFDICIQYCYFDGGTGRLRWEKMLLMYIIF